MIKISYVSKRHHGGISENHEWIEDPKVSKKETNQTKHKQPKRLPKNERDPYR